MAPKKATTTAKKASGSSKAAPAHPGYKDMIKDAIVQLKERNGSSRQALKKYIQSNHKITAPTFESLFNAALRRGVTNGDFIQPKGPSGTVKLNKKTPAPAAKKPKAAAATKPKAAAKPKAASSTTKKAAPKKTGGKTAASKVTKKPAAAKKAAPKKKTAAK